LEIKEKPTWDEINMYWESLPIYRKIALLFIIKNFVFWKSKKQINPQIIILLAWFATLIIYFRMAANGFPFEVMALLMLYFLAKLAQKKNEKTN